MALTQYDLLLTQVSAGGADFTEKYVNIAKGALLSSLADGTPAVLAPGTDGWILKRDASELTGLKWIDAASLVTGISGTASTVFELDTDGYKVELTAESASKFGVKVDGGATYADLQAKDATFAKVTVSAAPSSDTDLANKAYVDGIIAANDAMVFKGTVGTAGTHTIVEFNALTVYNKGWSYKVITAGTVKGIVCEIGDLLISMVDRASAGIDADWTSVQTNQDGVVTGPASATDNYVALFSGTSGKLLKAGTGALGTAAYTAATAYATAAQGTAADAAIPKSVLDAETILYATVSDTPAALVVGASTFVGRKASGSVSAMSVAEAKTLLAYGTMAAETATNYVLKSLYDAYSILYADTDNTPAALAVGASTFIGRKSTGGIAALTANEAMKQLWVTAPAAKNSTGVADSIARDTNFFYICTATDTWKRSPIATNW